MYCFIAVDSSLPIHFNCSVNRKESETRRFFATEPWLYVLSQQVEYYVFEFNPNDQIATDTFRGFPWLTAGEVKDYLEKL